MLIKTRGIVFRSMKYRETSLILDIYTEEKGLRKYLINGVRTARARTPANLLQVISLVDLVAYERDDRSLHRLKEVRPALVYQSTPFNVRKGAVALFMAEIARRCIRESEENRPLFNFLFDTFAQLDDCQENIANHHLHFMSRLTYFLGFSPQGHFSEATPYFDLREGTFSAATQTEHRHYLDQRLSLVFDQLLDLPREEAHLLALTPTERRALLQHLLDYYRLQIENFPEIKAHLILQEVLG